MNLYAYAGNNPIAYTDPFGLDPCKISSAWTECLAQALANWGARQGGTTGAVALNLGAALNAGLEVSGVNAAASAGDALGNGNLVAGGAGVALAVVPLVRGGGGAASGTIRGFTKHGINQAISRDGVGVSTSAIRGAVGNPIKVIQQVEGKLKYVGENATVILNDAGEVVSTWARNSAGWRIAP